MIEAPKPQALAPAAEKKKFSKAEQLESMELALKQATEESAPLSKPQAASDPAASDPVEADQADQAGFAPQQKFQNYKFQIAEHEENSQQDSDARLLHIEGSIY